MDHFVLDKWGNCLDSRTENKNIYSFLGLCKFSFGCEWLNLFKTKECGKTCHSKFWRRKKQVSNEMLNKVLIMLPSIVINCTFKKKNNYLLTQPYIRVPTGPETSWNFIFGFPGPGKCLKFVMGWNSPKIHGIWFWAIKKKKKKVN